MTLLYLAMFQPSNLWLQLLSHQLSSLFALYMLVRAQPFESYLENSVNILNEAIMLSIVYLLVCVASFEQNQTQMGLLIAHVIMTSWFANGAIILYLFLKELCAKLRRACNKRIARKEEKSRIE